MVFETNMNHSHAFPLKISMRLQKFLKLNLLKSQDVRKVASLFFIEETFDRLSYRGGAPLYWTTNVFEQHALHDIQKGNAILYIPNKGIRFVDGPIQHGTHSVALELFQEKHPCFHENAFLLLAGGYPTIMDKQTGSFVNGSNCLISISDEACAEFGFTATLLFKPYNVHLVNIDIVTIFKFLSLITF